MMIPLSLSVNIPTTNKPRLVVIGGGFAGMHLIKSLKQAELQIVLIDKNNYHTFQPLLYQVATAGLEPDSIAFPLRKIFKHQKNLFFRMAEVIKIDPAQKTVETSIGKIPYDYLVLAMGSKTNYLGMEDVKKYAMSMKSLTEALDLRSLMLQNFEAAILATDLKERQSLMTFVVVGGGPTGVEMAGALGELKNHILPADYPELDLDKMQIHIIDAAQRLLPTMSQEASKGAMNFLQKFDVNIWLNTKVALYDGFTLTLDGGKQIPTRSVIWAAGVMGAAIAGLNPEVLDKNNRIHVDEYSRVQGYEDIFAIGDVAAMQTKDHPHGFPMLAPVAIQQGTNLARNLQHLLNNESLNPFHFHYLGVMATVGRNQAVVDLPFVKFQGILGWFIWVFVHLMTLVGFRNRVVTFVNWVFSYLSYDKGIRLIVRPFPPRT